MGDLSSIENERMIIVPTDISEHHERIREVSETRNLLSISTDQSCVESGDCIVAISAVPKIIITINLAAAKKAGIKFSPAFQMMVEEVE